MLRTLSLAFALAASGPALAAQEATDPAQAQALHVKQALGTITLAYYANRHCPSFALTDATVLRVQMDILMRQARAMRLNDVPGIFTQARDQALQVRCDDPALLQQVAIARRLTFDALGNWLVLAEGLIEAGLGPQDLEQPQLDLVLETAEKYRERLKENLNVEQWEGFQQRWAERAASVGAEALAAAERMLQAPGQEAQMQGRALADRILSERAAATEIAWAMVVDTQVREGSGRGLRADPLDTGWVAYRPGPSTDTASWHASHVSNCRHLAVDCEFVLVVGDNGHMEAAISPRIGRDGVTVYIPEAVQVLIRDTEKAPAPERGLLREGSGVDQEALQANAPGMEVAKVAVGRRGPQLIPPPEGLPVRADALHFAMGSQLLPEIRALTEDDVIVLRTTYAPAGGGESVTVDLNIPMAGLQRSLYWARVGLTQPEGG